MSDGDESYSNKEQPTRHHPVQSASFTKGQKKSRHVSIIAARNPQGKQALFVCIHTRLN
jgi:hypothetical protein